VVNPFKTTPVGVALIEARQKRDEIGAKEEGFNITM